MTTLFVQYQTVPVALTICHERIYRMSLERIKQKFIEVGIEKFLAAIVSIIILGGIAVTEYIRHDTDIPENAKRLVNTPTSKEEDLNQVANKLATILNEVQDLKTMVEAKKINTVKEVKVGINKAELSLWKISVLKNNSLDLKENDQILIINKALESKPSAIFTVSFVRLPDEGVPNRPEVYMNEDSAKFLGIDHPETVGVFSLSFQKIEQIR